MLLEGIGSGVLDFRLLKETRSKAELDSIFGGEGTFVTSLLSTLSS